MFLLPLLSVVLVVVVVVVVLVAVLVAVMAYFAVVVCVVSWVYFANVLPSWLFCGVVYHVWCAYSGCGSLVGCSCCVLTFGPRPTAGSASRSS